jgi:hypothetical protein
MSANDLTVRLNEAIALIKAGQSAQARAILLLLVQQYPTSEAAWLWLATASADVKERVAALRQVLALNPYNEKARAALAQLTGEDLPAPPPRVVVPSSAEVAAPPVTPVPSAAPGLPAAPSKLNGKLFEQVLLVVMVIIAVGLGVLFTGDVVLPRLFPSATPTPSITPLPTRTLTPTLPTPTNTPSFTPGGPTITPPGPTLPPTWTPRASITPRLTATPRDTLPPLPPPTQRPTREPTPSFTPFPTRTPFPTDTPRP